MVPFPTRWMMTANDAPAVAVADAGRLRFFICWRLVTFVQMPLPSQKVTVGVVVDKALATARLMGCVLGVKVGKLMEAGMVVAPVGVVAVAAANVGKLMAGGVVAGAKVDVGICVVMGVVVMEAGCVAVGVGVGVGVGVSFFLVTTTAVTIPAMIRMTMNATIPITTILLPFVLTWSMCGGQKIMLPYRQAQLHGNRRNGIWPCPPGCLA